MNAYRWHDPARRQPPALTAEDAIMHAITSPGVLTPRRQHEPLTRWQARAVLTAIRDLATQHKAQCYQPCADPGCGGHLTAAAHSHHLTDFADLLKENP